MGPCFVTATLEAEGLSNFLGQLVGLTGLSQHCMHILQSMDTDRSSTARSVCHH